MKLGGSLLQKGILLVVAPLTFQLAVLGGLSYLQAQAEEVASRAEHAAAINETMNLLVRGLLDNLPTWEWNSDRAIAPDYNSLKEDLLAYLKRLKVLMKDRPDHVAVVQEVEQGAHEALDMMESHRKNPSQDSDKQVDKANKARFKLVKAHLTEVISDKLLPLASEERRILRESPALQAQNRERVRQLLLVAAFVNIVLAVILVFFYNRDTVRRLSTIFDNSLKLASRKPLSPVLEGFDEIARLDQIFHEMADSLAEAAHKEAIVIENAQDLICSLDARGTFITVNPAAKQLIGYSPEDLIGSKISNLIPPAEKEHVQANLKLIMHGEPLARFETRMMGKDAKVVDTLWSARWSSQEDSIFCVIHDITERKQVERLRQEVVQMVSHDLRSPLTTIRGILEIVSSGRVGELTERGKEMIQTADRSSMQMLALVRDLLEIEKMEAGQLELNKKEVSLSEIFNQSVEAVSIMGHKRHVAVKAVDTSITVLADGDRLVQILVNLLTNAVKFSPPNSTVTLSARSINGFVEINVADQGRGIPAHLMSTIFDRFKQVRESDSKAEGGSGLGLAICKALVELHGGGISVSSEEGKGSVFTVRIPC
ncbi:MAG: PAS domain S-box protein [Cyanobacteria bacterium SZAS LIN-2]|nr:PAS domain S-box protein [Cyanobacteria bacterium SZAS LIN-3]MBS1994807.1 PAS domain S-box protein [Cyanobacteria bacterium SZAS LIN-2]